MGNPQIEFHIWKVVKLILLYIKVSKELKQNHDSIVIYLRDVHISFLKSFFSIQKKSFFSFLKFFFNPKAKCRQIPSFPHSRNFFFSIQTFLLLILKNFFFQKIYFFHFQKYFLRSKRCTKILSFSYSHYFHYFIFNLKKKIFFSFSNNFFNPKTKYT